MFVTEMRDLNICQTLFYEDPSVRKKQLEEQNQPRMSSSLDMSLLINGIFIVNQTQLKVIGLHKELNALQIIYLTAAKVCTREANYNHFPYCVCLLLSVHH